MFCLLCWTGCCMQCQSREKRRSCLPYSRNWLVVWLNCMKHPGAQMPRGERNVRKPHLYAYSWVVVERYGFFNGPCRSLESRVADGQYTGASLQYCRKVQFCSGLFCCRKFISLEGDIRCQKILPIFDLQVAPIAHQWNRKWRPWAAPCRCWMWPGWMWKPKRTRSRLSNWGPRAGAQTDQGRDGQVTGTNLLEQTLSVSVAV